MITGIDLKRIHIIMQSSKAPNLYCVIMYASMFLVWQLRTSSMSISFGIFMTLIMELETGKCQQKNIIIIFPGIWRWHILPRIPQWHHFKYHKVTRDLLIVLTSFCLLEKHYSNVLMSALASQITGVSIVFSIVCSGADQRKHQSSASLALVREIHWWPVVSPHKGSVTRKMFTLDDIIMKRIRNHRLPLDVWNDNIITMTS